MINIQNIQLRQKPDQIILKVTNQLMEVLINKYKSQMTKKFFPPVSAIFFLMPLNNKNKS